MVGIQPWGWISSNGRPQDPGGGAPTGSPALSVGESPSVPSRISVVCPREDTDIRLLAGEAKPARVTIFEDDLGSPCVGGRCPPLTLPGDSCRWCRLRYCFRSVLWIHQHCPLGDLRRFPHGFRWCGSRRPKLRTLHVWGVHVRIRICGYWLEWRSRLVGPFVKEVLDRHVLGRRCLLPTVAGRLLPVVPAGISFPVGPVSPAGPNGPYAAGGPVGPYGTLSPSDSHPAGLAGPYVAGGPVGPDGTLPQFFSDPAGPAGCAGGLLLARMGRCPHLTLTLLTRLARILQGALLAQMGLRPHMTLTLLARLALRVALLARMGLRPHMTLTLLAQLARMLQGALLAQVGRCPRFSLTLLARLAFQVALLARMGCCPRLNMILLARMGHMVLLALWARLGHCPCLDLDLRYWWTLGGVFPLSDPTPGVRYLQVWKDRRRVQIVWGPLPELLWWAGMPIR